ncbi:F-box only protein 7-like isoform X1 [Tachysurus ichikawai]
MDPAFKCLSGFIFIGGNAGLVYRDMQKLSCVFKDILVYPLIARVRDALGLPALFGLTVLPPELLLSIMGLLNFPSIIKLSEVCRYLHSFTQDASLWKHFVYRDFGAGTKHRDTDWHEVYKKKFQQKKAQRKCRMRRDADFPPIYPHLQDSIVPLPVSLPPSPQPPPPTSIIRQAILP